MVTNACSPHGLFDVTAPTQDHPLMSRLPFDPNRAKGGASERARRADAAMTVSQVADRIGNALAQQFPAKIQVVGEISNLRDRQHWFFSLKDEAASIRCVCFASTARKTRVRIQDGMQVMVTGRVDFYPAQGSVQIYVDAIEPLGQGALELALRKLMEELREQGYFAIEHKKPLPAVPRKVAVVTSRSAAALEDVIDTARRRWTGCQLYLVDVRVQGDSASSEIARAIRALSAHGRALGIQGIILTRGGGSIEDLWAFNERNVADAIYDCTLPVVAAIGHETDTTVAELVADQRCATPTQAAMHLIPDHTALQQQVVHLGGRLRLMLQRQWRHEQQRLAAITRHALFRAPQRLVDQASQRLDRGISALAAALPRQLNTAKERLAADTRHLQAVGPVNVLNRGYTYTLDERGHVLRSAKAASVGRPITTVLADGRILSRVEDGSDNKAAAADRPSSPHPARRSRRKRPSDEDQPGLFSDPT